MYRNIESKTVRRQVEIICYEIDNLKVQIGMIVTGVEQLQEEMKVLTGRVADMVENPNEP